MLAIGPVRSADAGESVQSVEKSPRKKTDDVARHVDLVIGALPRLPGVFAAG